MQEAGYILLMPGGDWNANTAYHILHLVNHSGASWVCKKDCTGQEPSDSNTEFWQRFGTAVDLSNYFPKSGGTINGSVIVNSTQAASILLFLQNSMRSVYQEITAKGTYIFYDKTNGKEILKFTVDGTNTFNGTASGNLPITGGTVESENDTPLTLKSKTTSVFLRLLNSEGKGWYFGLDSSGEPRITGKGTLLHTGNKPTGTYTGNGDAMARKIAIGGIGDVVVLTSVNGSAIVTVGGTTINSPSGGVSRLSSDEIKAFNGYLNLATTNSIVNGNGVEVTYRVL